MLRSLTGMDVLFLAGGMLLDGSKLTQRYNCATRESSEILPQKKKLENVI